MPGDVEEVHEIIIFSKKKSSAPSDHMVLLARLDFLENLPPFWRSADLVKARPQPARWSVVRSIAGADVWSQRGAYTKGRKQYEHTEHLPMHRRCNG